MEKINKPITIMAMVCGISALILAAYGLTGNRVKTGYIDQAKLFSEFKMKKVLETEFQKVENMRKHQLDSMMLVVSMMEKQAASRGQMQYLYERKQELEYKKQEFAEMNETLKAQFNEQIWNQLTQYIKDYSEKNDYDYVLGGIGDGTVMFAAPEHEITSQIITYVNQRFDGEKK